MNTQHERNLHLRWHLHDPRAKEQLEVPWRTNGIIGQCVFFVLTCIGLGAAFGLLSLFELPKQGVFMGVAAIALAEVLIAKRWFFTGVETALWVAGLGALISELPRSGTIEALLVVAAAAAIAGARLRNPLFGTIAAVLVLAYVEQRFDLGLIFALGVALLACVALLRTWQRPTTEWLWIALTIVMPIAGRFTADEKWRFMTIALYLVYGAVALVLALTRRHHALFFSAMIGLAIAGIDLREFFPAPAEVKLAASGFALLAIAFVISRALRDRTRGFVLTPLQLTPFDDAIEASATLALRPEVSTAPPPEPVQGGGSFGGAGASGDF